MKTLLAAFFIALTIVITTSVQAEDNPVTGLTQKPTTKVVQLETRQEKMATRSAALKKKIEAFKDKKKASAAGRINDNLTKVNQTRTSEMLTYLNRLSSILQRLETRVNAITGKDTTSATTAISSAKAAIDIAKATITAQSEKDYIITVTNETKVKTDAMTEREALHTDLLASHSLVLTARKAVTDAIVATAKLGGIK